MFGQLDLGAQMLEPKHSKCIWGHLLIDLKKHVLYRQISLETFGCKILKKIYFGNKTPHQSPTFPKFEGLTQLRKDSHPYRNKFIQFHFAVHSLHPFHPVSACPSGSMKRWWMGRAHLTCVDTSNAWKHQSKDHLDMGMVEWCMGKNKLKHGPEWFTVICLKQNVGLVLGNADGFMVTSTKHGGREEEIIKKTLLNDGICSKSVRPLCRFECLKHENLSNLRHVLRRNLDG